MKRPLFLIPLFLALCVPPPLLAGVTEKGRGFLHLVDTLPEKLSLEEYMSLYEEGVAHQILNEFKKKKR